METGTSLKKIGEPVFGVYTDLLGRHGSFCRVVAEGIANMKPYQMDKLYWLDQDYGANVFMTISKDSDTRSNKNNIEEKKNDMKLSLQNSKDYISLLDNYWKIGKEGTEIRCPVDSENDVLSWGLAFKAKYSKEFMAQNSQICPSLYDDIVRVVDYISKDEEGEKIAENVHSFIEPIWPVIKQRFGLKC